MISSKKLLALILAMAIAAAGLAFLQASAEEGAADQRHAMASAAAAVQGQDGGDGFDQVVALPWRRVLRHRGRKENGGGDGRSWRIPPSGPSSRGHVAVDADAPEKEEKTATTTEGCGGGGGGGGGSWPRSSSVHP
uniref:Uncharacterized protein n=1 Tax=Oryza punctata TaxID=4537 RepID=A0A0E0JXS0_ORYPU